MNIPSDLNTYIPSMLGVGGTYSISDGIGRIYSPAGVSTKYEKSVLVGPGVKVEMKIYGRSTGGVGGAVAIDYLPLDRGGSSIEIKSREWREYVVSFTTPLRSPDNLRVTFAIGNFAAMGEGSFEFHTPRISIYDTDLGAPRILARGLILVSSGVPSLNSNYQADGIKSLSYDAAAAALTVTMRGNDGAGMRLHPLMIAQLTDDNTTLTGRRLHALCGRYNRDDGTARVTFVDGGTGQLQDISGLGNVYLTFRAEI
ncbi:hypothetical protein [Pseudomonas sp. CM27]|uniref:hypothetical protein n=1 Tax=Pseudomonas sp. CM27 TaxID=2738452 RepID=UPI00155250E3|nr:hypothetical protein [Pseudomonas sp. CM27]NQD77769.1 hypothetical protein [Pseudomonas sp. CM27]